MENYYNIVNYHLVDNRRLQKELIALYQFENHIYTKFVDKDKMKFTNDDIHFEIINSNKISFTLFYKERYTLHINMLIPREYPFRPPQCILTNELEYITQLVNITGHVYNFTTHVGESKKCFCCQSLTCRHNWGPKNTIMDMLNEIYDMFTLINNSVDKLLIKKINNKIKVKNILKEKLGYDLT